LADESYNHSVRDPDEFQRIQYYIENNPVAAGLAGTGEQYRWSSMARETPPQPAGLPHPMSRPL
jgi:hypothetical protein